MKERKRVQKVFTKPSLTRQEFKENCDLSLILKKFGKTPEGRAALQNAQGYAENAQFYDVSVVPDYRAALDQINAANAKFMALPAILRRRFDNDAAQFLDFVLNEDNLEECRKLGLAKPAPVSTPEGGGIGA